MKQIIFASKNRGKILEVEEIIKNSDIYLLSLLGVELIPDIVESGSTFEENARIKAEAVYNAFRIPTVADDSGLAVEQLDGRPGVYSARYSGECATDEENNEKLLFELNNFSEPHKAKYVCVAVFYDGKNFVSTTGEVHGKIVKERKGTNGFGYDPYFVPDGFNQTMAELMLKEKNKISHRAIAFNELKKIII
ncbi:MAG: RdgB/HAM1 family non-canonical purine NTP pyrophosphatase [Ignavibacteriaceae bacterium]